jgi:ribonuclease P protein component
VLSARHRLRRSADFSAVIRHGARAGRSAVVVHLLPADPAHPSVPADPADPTGVSGDADGPALVGYVVPRTVGTAVVRNQVTRRLRALCTDRIERSGLFPPGSRVVIRALPTAAVTSYSELGAQLDSALAGAVRKAGVVVPG